MTRPQAGEASERWREVADGVLVHRHPLLDQNTTLVLGDRWCLVVDTTAHRDHARELVDDLRSLTALPWVVANTHAHFDHCFGNSVLAAEQPGLEVWAHPGCRWELLARSARHRADGVSWMRRIGSPADLTAMLTTPVMAPTRTVARDQVLDLGGRRVRLSHGGRGHTDHDLVVLVPDVRVSVVGDLVEEGAPPDFEDSFPLEWPTTLDRLMPALGSLVVPGHGAPVDPGRVEEQGRELRRLAERAGELLTGTSRSSQDPGGPRQDTDRPRHDPERSRPGSGWPRPEHRVPNDLLLRAAAELRFGPEASLVGLRRALVTCGPPDVR